MKEVFYCVLLYSGFNNLCCAPFRLLTAVLQQFFSFFEIETSQCLSMGDAQSGWWWRAEEGAPSSASFLLLRVAVELRLAATRPYQSAPAPPSVVKRSGRPSQRNSSFIPYACSTRVANIDFANCQFGLFSIFCFWYLKKSQFL